MSRVHRYLLHEKLDCTRGLTMRSELKRGPGHHELKVFWPGPIAIDEHLLTNNVAMFK